METSTGPDPEEIREIATRLLALSNPEISETNVGENGKPEHLEKRGISPLTQAEQNSIRIEAMAVREYAARRERQKVFAGNSDIFGEPAWDILLDLTIQKVRLKRVTVTSVCIASAAPATTALRWIGILAERGLVSRTESKSDKRRAYIELTDKGWLKMANYFGQSTHNILHNGKRYGSLFPA